MVNNRTSIHLSEAPCDRELRIVALSCGAEARRKLLSMGLHVDDTIVRYQALQWGPVLIRNLTQNSSKIALGKGIARKITVSYDIPVV